MYLLSLESPESMNEKACMRFTFAAILTLSAAW